MWCSPLLLFLPLLWLLVGRRFSFWRSEGILLSRLKWLMSFCAENVCLGVFFKLRVIFGRLVHVHLKNYGLALLISSTDTEKMQVTASGAYHWNGKSGNTPHCAICSSNQLLCSEFCYLKAFYNFDPNSTPCLWIW